MKLSRIVPSVVFSFVPIHVYLLLVRKIKLNQGRKLLNINNLIAYGDDLLKSRRKKELKVITENLIDTTTDKRLEINEIQLKFKELKNKYTSSSKENFLIQSKRNENY